MSTFAELAIEFTSRTAAQAARDIQAVEGAAAGAEKAVDRLSTSGKDLDASTGKATMGAKKLTDTLDRQRGGARKATDEFYRMIGATNNAAAANDRAAPATRRLTDSLYKVGVGAQKATDGLENARGASEKTSGILGKLAGMAGGAAGKLAAMAAATFGFHQIITTLSSFEQEMAAVKAVSGATGDELQALRDTAKLLGATTEFSASQAAQGLKILTQAGYSARNAIATIPAVLDLATTESMDLGAATEYVNSIMSGFGLTVENAGRVADVLVYASNAASTGVAELGEGMKYVAPIARSLGINIEESAAAMGVLSDAGLKGTVAGTGLRSMMASLAAPSGDAAKAIGSLGLSLRDISPQSNSLTSIIAKLAGAGIDAGTAFRIFGTEAAPAVMALVANNDRLAEFVDNMSDIDGTAKRVADTMRDQLGGDIKGLTSAVEGLIISMGDAGLTAALRVAIQAVTSTVRAISTMIDMVSGAAKWIGEATGISWAFSTAVNTISETMGGLQGYVIAASVALGARFAPAIVGAMASAVGAVGAFTASLVTLRGALITTGIGAIVVAAGYLLNKFLDLVAATGGFGKAMSLLGEVAAGVWEGIKTSAASIPAGLASVWEKMKSDFLQTMAVISARWADFLSGMGLDKMAANAVKASTEFASASTDAMIAAGQARDAASSMASDGFDKAKEALEKLNVTVTTTTDTLGGTGTGTGSGLSGAATGAGKATDELRNEVKRLNDAAAMGRTPIEKYRAELEKLEKLKKLGLSDDAYAMELERINEELANGIPIIGDMASAWGDFVAGGFKDFKGFVESVISSFKGMLAEMIATAARNQIVVGLGLNGSVSAGGTAAAAATGSAMSGIGTAFSAISLGMSNFAGSIMSSAWGSISGAFSAGLAGLSTSVTTAFANLTGNVGALLTGSGSSIASSLGALGSAIGAIAGPIAIIAGLVSFFGTKTKLLDAGIKAVITDTDVLVSTYKKVKKSRFWGLSSSTSTSTKPASAEVADPITQAINATQASILSMASVLGVAADTFDSFSYELKVSTKGLSDEEIGKALAAAMSDAADAYALMIGGLDELIATGETATEALTRLSTALTTVNGAFDTLGYSLRYSGLAGAAVSSALEDLLGGADGFTSAVSTYWGTFYSATEQQAILTRQATTALAAYNAALPRSRDEYRALIDAQDLTTEAGRNLWAALVGMAGVMDQILPAVSGLTAELETLLGAVSTSLDATINAVTESQKAAAAAAGQWYKSADSIAKFVRSMRSTAGALVSPTQATAFSQAQYQTRLASALAGDLDAVNGLTGVAQTYLDAVGATAGSATELALAQARVLSDLGTVQGASQIEGARWDVIQGLYQDQVDLMQEVADYLAAGNALSEAQIATLTSQLGSLDDAIAAAAAINYASLQKQIDLSITAVEDAQIPEYLKALLRNADTGITSYVDFITRSDLTPDLKWLALTGASEMVKTVTYAAENDLGADLTRLAVNTVSTLRKTVNLLAGAGLDAETMQVALAGNSELARVVTATLATDIDAQAKRLAIGNVGAYSVSVMASLSPGVSTDVRRIVIDEQGSYAALIGATVSADLSSDVRRILLRQQGSYVANITGILVANMDAATRSLLLNANTSAARAITIATVYADSLTAAEIALLRGQATTASATIRAAIDLAGVSATGLLYLAQIGMGSTAVQKTLVGTIALSALSADARLLLSAVSETVQRSVAFRATGGATEDQLRLLGAVSATILRQVGFSATGALSADQRAMLGAGSGTVQRLLALATTGTLTTDQQIILATAASRVTRALILSTSGALTDDQAAILLAEAANVSRGLALTATGALSTDQRSMLAAVSATVTRQLALAAGGTLTTDQRTMLQSGAAYIARVIAMQARGVLTDDQRRILTATTGIVARTVNGLVNLAGLTAQQRTFLSAISGSTSGMLTLGGTFRFDPTSAFSTWYESATRASITAPMSALRSALGDLAAAVRAETARAAHETAVSGLNTYAAGLTRNPLGNYFVTDADLAAMAGIIGLNTAGQTPLQLRRAIAGYDAGDLLSSTIYDPTGSLEAAYLAATRPQNSMPVPASYALSDYQIRSAGIRSSYLGSYVTVTGPLGGTRGYPSQSAAETALAAQGYPAFARGGTHDGGPAYIGENDLELVAPSRIYNPSETRSMLDNRQVVEELRALREELRALKEEQRQLGLQTAENTRTGAKTLRKWDATGMPKEVTA